MSTPNPYQAPEAPVDTDKRHKPDRENTHLQGIRGWLILVAIGIVLSPFKILALIYTTYINIFTQGTWLNLTTPGTDAYDPLWAPIIIGELTINTSLTFVWIYIAVIFFSKKRVFPKWYIGIMIFTLIFILLDAIMVKAVLPDEAIFDPDTVKNLTRTAIAALIWIPYMLISKRVKATFIH